MHETEWVSLPVLQQTWWVYMAVPQFFSSYCFDAFAISLPKKDLVFCKPAYCHIIYFVFLFIAFFERNIGHNRCIVLQTEIALYTIFTAYAYYIIYWSKRLWTHFWNKVLLFSNDLHNSSNMTDPEFCSQHSTHMHFPPALALLVLWMIVFCPAAWIHQLWTLNISTCVCGVQGWIL